MDLWKMSLAARPTTSGKKRAGHKVRRAMNLEAAGGQLATQLADRVAPLMSAGLVILAPQERIRRHGQAQQSAIFQHAPHLAQRAHIVVDRLQHVARDDGVERIRSERQVLRTVEQTRFSSPSICRKASVRREPCTLQDTVERRIVELQLGSATEVEHARFALAVDGLQRRLAQQSCAA